MRISVSNYSTTEADAQRAQKEIDELLLSQLLSEPAETTWEAVVESKEFARSVKQWRALGGSLPDVPAPDLPDLGGTTPETPAPDLPDDGLWSVVRSLPPKQRAAVVHRLVLDLAYVEIGDRMGISEEAARQNVSAGLRRLRAEVTA